MRSGELTVPMTRGLNPGVHLSGQDVATVRQAIDTGRFVVEVKVALERGGMHSEGFSGHSFPIGVATTAAEVVVGDVVIQLLGRWKSDAYKGYVKGRNRLGRIGWSCYAKAGQK